MYYKIVFEAKGSSELDAYVHLSGAAAMHNFSNKVHVDSEYDTHFSVWVEDLKKANIIESLTSEWYIGVSNVIIKFNLRIPSGVGVFEVVKEFSRYMNDDSIDYQYMINLVNINHQ